MRVSSFMAPSAPLSTLSRYTTLFQSDLKSTRLSSILFFFLNDPPPPEIYPLPLPDALPIPGAGDPAHGPAPPGPADRRGPAGPRRARHDAPAAPRHDGGARLGARERAGRESSRGSDARG